MQYLMLLLSAGLSLGAIAGCGDNKLVNCGDGTKLQNGECVGSAGPTCGAGTTLVDGMCVSMPGPTCGSGTTLENGMCIATPITPTTCGPGTVLQNNACVVDHTAPDPVTNLAATIAGANVNLSWTAGTGSTATLVARLDAGAYDAPAPNTIYTVGQTLPGGAKVIAVGAGTSATDAFTTPGRFSYLAWSQNASGNYGFPREVSAVTLPAQTGAISVDVAALTATVTTQPANLALAAANVAYDAGTSTLTFDLTATNSTAGQLYNLKAAIAAPSVGTVANASGTMDGGDPFYALASAATLPTQTGTHTVTITGVGATDTVTVPVTLVESGLGQVGSNLTDAQGSPGLALRLPALRGRGLQDSLLTTSAFSASGRYVFGLSRWTTGFFRVDTSTGDVSAISPLTVATGSGACAVFDADGYVYVVYGIGTHRNRNASGFVFAKVDPISMTVVARSAQLFPANTGTVRKCAKSGTELAMAFGPDVYFGDTSTMAFVDADATTATVIDPVQTGGARLMDLAFSPNGATVYASEIRGSNIYAVDVVGLTSTTYHTAPNRVYSLTVDGAGTLWWGDDNGLYSFDGTTEAPVPGFTGKVRAIGPRIGTTFAVADDSSTFQLDTTTGAVTHQGPLGTNNRPGHSYALFATP